MGPWHDFWMGGFWMFPILMMLLIIVCIFLFARLFLGWDWQPPRMRRGDTEMRSKAEDSPLEIAKRRYAKGEITKEEYEEIKKTIA